MVRGWLWPKTAVFAINRFRYDEKQPPEGSAFLTLYAGIALVSTGQLAKISPDAFLFRTAVGVIRPFGTTFNGGGCIGNFCASGSVTVNSDGGQCFGQRQRRRHQCERQCVGRFRRRESVG
jgi:hypothetical protein